MTQETELDAYIPALKRFARALCGGETIGSSPAHEELVRRTLQIAAAEAKGGRRDQIRLNLLKSFYRLRQKAPIRGGRSDGRLAAALQEMPLAHRAALLLVALEELSYAHTADVLGVNRRALIDLLVSARRMLEGYTFSAVVPADTDL